MSATKWAAARPEAASRDIPSRLTSALALHRAGDLDGAETVYRAIIDSDPTHADALHLLGVIALSRGHFEAAANRIEQAIAVRPRKALFHCNLGAAYRSLGRDEDALAAFRRALDIDSAHTGARYNLALALEAQGALPAAALELEQVVAHDQNLAEAWHARGRIAAARGQTEEAERFYRHAIALRASFVEAHYNLANLLKQTGHAEAAVAEYQHALAATSGRFPARSVAQIHNNLGDALKELGREHDAIDAFERALRIDPNFAEARNNLGAALHLQGDLAGAESALRRALQLDPRMERAWTNLGNLLVERDCLDAALSCYDCAIAIAADSPARFNRSLLLLQMGRLESGWSEYESRFDKNVPRRDFEERCWDGSPLAGRTLLIYGEQGVGDEVMFASCLPDLAGHAHTNPKRERGPKPTDTNPKRERGPALPGEHGQTLIECQARLVPLFTRSFPWAKVFARPIQRDATGRVQPAVDVQIPMGSLPRLTRPSWDAFPSHGNFLRADPERTALWHDRVRRGDQQTLIVGISWRGGAEPQIIRKRSTSAFHWAPLGSVSNVKYLSLQYGETEANLEAFESAGLRVEHFDEIDPLTDLDEFAALLAACDLVISTDNSTVHLAGALGTPVWTLLPNPADWRWFRDPTQTAWYPSMRLYRQSTPGDWSEVFARVTEDLIQLRASARQSKIQNQKSKIECLP